TAGFVRLAETGIFGYAEGPVTGGVMTIALKRFGRRPVSEFNFTVGTTVTADPNAYTIATGSLSLASIQSDTPVAVRGFVAPWNSAGQNAAAVTVVDRSAFALLYCDWA